MPVMSGLTQLLPVSVFPIDFKGNLYSSPLKTSTYSLRFDAGFFILYGLGMARALELIGKIGIKGRGDEPRGHSMLF